MMLQKKKQSFIKQFVCDYCSGSYVHRADLIIHIRNNHSGNPERKFLCHLCNACFKNKNWLSRHISQCHKENFIKRNICNYCSQLYATQANLMKHIKNNHTKDTEMQQKLFACNLCNTFYKNKIWLGRHLAKLHVQTTEVQEETQQPVDEFNNILKNLKALDAQSGSDKLSEIIDNNEIIFIPEVDIQQLKVTVPNGQRFYHCNFCTTKCKTLSLLQRHILVHSNIKPYKCVVCNVKFRYSSSLRKHAKKQHSFKCSDNRSSVFIVELAEYAKKLKSKPSFYNVEKKKAGKIRKKPISENDCNDGDAQNSLTNLDTNKELINSEADVISLPQPMANDAENVLRQLDQRNLMIDIDTDLIKIHSQRNSIGNFQIPHEVTAGFRKSNEKIKTAYCGNNLNNKQNNTASLITEPIQYMVDNDISLDVSISDLPENSSYDNISLSEIDVQQFDIIDNGLIEQNTQQETTPHNNWSLAEKNLVTNGMINNNIVSEISDAPIYFCKENNIEKVYDVIHVKSPMNSFNGCSNKVIISQSTPDDTNSNIEPISTNNKVVNIKILEEPNSTNCNEVYFIDTDGRVIGKSLATQNLDVYNKLKLNDEQFSELTTINNNNNTNLGDLKVAVYNLNNDNISLNDEILQDVTNIDTFVNVKESITDKLLFTQGMVYNNEQSLSLNNEHISKDVSLCSKNAKELFTGQVTTTQDTESNTKDKLFNNNQYAENDFHINNSDLTLLSDTGENNNNSTEDSIQDILDILTADKMTNSSQNDNIIVSGDNISKESYVQQTNKISTDNNVGLDEYVSSSENNDMHNSIPFDTDNLINPDQTANVYTSEHSISEPSEVAKDMLLDVNIHNEAKNTSEKLADLDLVQTSQQLLQSLISDEIEESVAPSVVFEKLLPVTTTDADADEERIIVKLLSKRNLNYLKKPKKPFACDLCPATFKTNNDLKQHSNIHMKKAKLKCDLCDKSYSSKKSLALHKKYHSSSKVQCQVCGQSIHPLSLTNHMRQHNNVTPYRCALCGEDFKNVSAKNYHIRTKHINKDSSQPTNTSLVDLISDVMDADKTETSILTNISQVTESATKKKKSKSNTKTINICDVCGKSFEKLSLLVRHKRCHQDQTYYACECGMLFSSTTFLSAHKLKYNNKPHKCAYCCSICGDLFDTKLHLIRHARLKNHKSN